MNTKFLWWGYVHQNGSLQAKRYFSAEDLEEARQSPFVYKIINPFYASNRDEALKQIEKESK